MDLQLSFGITKEEAVDELIYYFESDFSMELDEDELTGISRGGRGNTGKRSSREMANLAIRKLQEYRWISIEMNKSRQQHVVLEDYAVEIIKTLVHISEEERIEYQGYIYTIYALMAQKSYHPGITLMGIFENTERLIMGLKNLNANIKKYMDALTDKKTVAEIMSTLFDDYMINIIDKAYHRLITSDNVSKFRPEIVTWLRTHTGDQQYVSMAAQDISEMKELSREDAKEYVYDMLHHMLDSFQRLDELIEDITKRSADYQRAAVERAKFLITSKADVRGQLKEILFGLNQIAEEKSLDFNRIYEFEFLDQMICLSSVACLDEQSFYQSIEGRRKFIPEQAEEKEITPQEKEEKKRRLEQKLKRVLSVEKIEEYVMGFIGKKDKILASQLPMQTEEDFIRIIYIRLYGQRKQRKYLIETIEGEEKNIETFRFRDFWIVRNEKEKCFT